MIDLTKPVRTKCGFKATIVDYKLRGDKPLLVVVSFSNVDMPGSYGKDGRYLYSEDDPMDLENYEPESAKEIL